MSISERLQMVIKMNGMNNTSFADKIGVQRSSISHVLAGRNKPSIDFIQKILVNFPKVNADWLITGKKIGKTSDSTVRPEPEKHLTLQAETAEEEERPVYHSAKQDQAEIGNKKLEESISDKQIARIVVFYTDGTFEETLPKEAQRTKH